MRHLTLLFVIPFLILLLGSDSPKEYDGTTTLADGLEGNWLCVKVEHNGHAMMHLRGVETFRGRKWEHCTNDHRQTGSYTADSRTNPGYLDIVGSDDAPTAPRRYIYRVDGDALRIGYNLKIGERPHNFSDSDLFVVTYRRVKK